MDIVSFSLLLQACAIGALLWYCINLEKQLQEERKTIICLAKVCKGGFDKIDQMFKVQHAEATLWQAAVDHALERIEKTAEQQEG